LDQSTAESKALERSFIGELLACAVADSDWKVRISAFKKNPTSNLARLLELRKPYQGKLYSQSTQRPAEMVLLKDLQDNDSVLFSTLSIDTKFYNSISGDVRGWKVYKASPDLGVMKDKKGWVALTEPLEITAKLTSRLLEAIASSNSSVKKSSAVAVLDKSENLNDDVDI
jgi:hypothetical protein